MSLPMSADPSLRKQQYIYIIAVVLTIIGFGATAFLSSQISTEQNSPFTVTSGQITDKEGNPTVRFGPQTEVTAKANTQIQERDNQYFLTTGSTGLFQTYQNETYFYNGTGSVYMEINSPLKFNVNNQLISLAKVKVIFDAETKELYLIEGDIEPNVAKQNQLVIYQDSKFVASAIVRANLTKFSNLISFIKERSSLPSGLSDLTPPTIAISEPTDLTTGKREITIKGTTEAQARLTINNSRIEVNGSGEFSAVVGLIPGSNQLKLVAIDSANNIGEKTVTIIRKGEVVKPVVVDTTDCSSGDIENKLFCEINNYIANSSGTKLKFNDKLGEIAEAYSVSKFESSSNPTMTTSAREAGVSFASSKEFDVQLHTGFSAQTLLEQVLVKTPDLVTAGYSEVGIGVYEEQLSVILIK